MQILAATDFSTRSNRALRQAGLLAQPVQAQLHLLHVVDDDQPQDLVRMEEREAGRLLAEQACSMPELRGVQSHPVVVRGDPFDGILRTAAAVQADLIIMGSHRKQLLLDIFIGTTVERVIRKGAFPVLMVSNEAQRRYENVIAPVDMSAPAANALLVAVSTGLIGDKGATLLHAFSPAAKGSMRLADAAEASINEYIESERQRAIAELTRFLEANELSHGRWYFRVEEGRAMHVISDAVSRLRPDLLVMGTHGRSGLLKTLLGSVTEEALRSLSVDILAVPAKS